MLIPMIIMGVLAVGLVLIGYQRGNGEHLTGLKPACTCPLGLTSDANWNKVPPPVIVKVADDSVWPNAAVR